MTEVSSFTTERLESPRWWGTFELAMGEKGLWRVGPATLLVERTPKEWRVQHLSKDDFLSTQCEMEIPTVAEHSMDGATLTRCGFEESPSPLTISPRLPDRSMVITPENSFQVPKGERVTLFCSTPVWASVQVGPHPILVGEFPLFRSPDTWFGTSTREGELAYATKTAARLERRGLQNRPHRAMTEVRIDNRSDRSFVLDKLNLPVKYLSLHADAAGWLWTDRVTLDRVSSGAFGELHIGEGPPDDLQSTPVSGPRQPSEENLAVRAFSALFDFGSERWTD